MSHHRNKVRIKAVARGLQELNADVVFLGGASISLYADEIDLPDHRPTDDVDIIIEMSPFREHARIQERLRALGFKEDHESHVICRWKIDGVVVDIMPIEGDILGFTNSWYSKVYKERYTIPLDDVEVNILPIHLLILTKWEALLKRDGGVDWRWSHDFEDIIKVMIATDDWQISKLKAPRYKTEFVDVLAIMLANDDFFFEACRAHLNPNFYSDNVINQLIAQIKKEINA